MQTVPSIMNYCGDLSFTLWEHKSGLQSFLSSAFVASRDVESRTRSYILPNEAMSLATCFVLAAALLSSAAETSEDCEGCATPLYKVSEIKVPIDDEFGTQPAGENNRIEDDWLFISSENRSSEDVLESESSHESHCSPAIRFGRMVFDVNPFLRISKLLTSRQTDDSWSD